MKLLKIILISLIMGFTSLANADSKKEDVARIKAAVLKELKSEPTSITESPIPGLYQVSIGPQVFYFYKDGRHVISGDMFDMSNGVNLTQSARSKAQLAGLRVRKQENLDALDKMGEANMIVFAPKGEVKHTISVFTDIDCGYCRKLHNEMAKYNDLGIKIRYLAYPRAGVASASYKKAVSVWCSEDKKQAMNRAKTGQSVPTQSCDNPVKAQMALGQRFGVNGTPALVLDNGQLYPGYAPAEKLIVLLESIKKDTKN